MPNSVTTLYLVAKEKAENGVVFSPRTGATCPFCGRKRIRIYSTKPWDGRNRIRYHRCQNPVCLLHKMDQTIKSVEEDIVDDTGEGK
jgi:hypothetical protein